MAAATPPPHPMDWPRPKPPSSPLEHQFLPPSISRPASWGDDAARLQQLMLGAPRVAAAGSSGRSGSSAARDLGGLFDFDCHKPLPSGWERCLDLKSGQVYLVKSDSNVNAQERQSRSLSTHQLDLKPSAESVKASQSLSEKDPREDWSLRWLQGKSASPSEDSMSNGKSYKPQEGLNLKRGDEGRESPSQPEREALCLDLDLKLTSKHQPAQPEGRKSCANSDMTEMMKASIGKRNFVDRSQSESLISASKMLSSAASARAPVKEEIDMLQQQQQQQWKWRLGDNSVQEMVRESTMAPAVCSSCLMYVLLRKTNPTCPRCGNRIILDCSSHRSSKRPRLDLTPDDLSLSTDFSR